MLYLKRYFAVCIAVCVILALSLSTGVSAGDDDIVISEVSYNATCKGTDDTTCGTASPSETHFEWVEICNKDAVSVNINNWKICDNSACDSLPDQDIGPGEYWIIAYNTTALQTEFNQYSPAYTVNVNRTISLNSPLGGGLANDPEDVVYLLNSSGTTVDCVAWATTAGTTCASRTYVSGGNGSDTDLNNAKDGQSITNIQGIWYEHGPSDAAQQASPYDPNTNTAGATAITLAAFAAHVVDSASPWLWPLAALIATATLILAGLLWARRRRLV